MILDDVEFQPYLKDRLIHKRSGGHYVIVPVGANRPVPLSCPVCDFLLRSRDDESSWHKFKCCERCATFWAIPRKKEWDSGWRPSDEELQKEILSRSPIVVDVMIE